MSKMRKFCNNKSTVLERPLTFNYHFRTDFPKLCKKTRKFRVLAKRVPADPLQIN